jgi:hypothetical protein
VALAFVLAVAGSATVSADTALGHHGKIGVASLHDSAVDGDGGARCAYSLGDARDGGAATIKVRAPRVLARDRTAGIDHQVVGWRVILQQTPSDIGFGTWYTVYTSSIVKAGATDSTKASFGPRAFGVPFNTFVRARVQVFWFVPGSQAVVQGSQLRSVDHYDRFLDGNFEDQVADYCPPDLTNP